MAITLANASPANASTLSFPVPTVTVTNDGGVNSDVEFQVSSDKAFASTLVDVFATNQPNGNVALPSGVNTGNGGTKYYWRARAANTGTTNWTAWSGVTESQGAGVAPSAWLSSNLYGGTASDAGTDTGINWGGGPAGQWIRAQFATPQILWGISFRNRTGELQNAPSAWKVQASNDGTNWVDQDSRSGVVLVDGVVTTFQLQTPDGLAYTYWRMLTSANINNGWETIRNLTWIGATVAGSGANSIPWSYTPDYTTMGSYGGLFVNVGLQLTPVGDAFGGLFTNVGLQLVPSQDAVGGIFLNELSQPRPVLGTGAIATSAPAMWLRVDDLLGFSDGQSIDSIMDRSGNSADATQGTVANQAVYKANVTPTGKPVARFTGSQTYTSGASASSSAQTVFAVARPAGPAQTRTIRGATAQGGLQFRYESTGKLGAIKQNIAGAGAGLTASSTTAFEVIAFRYDASGNWEFMRNGVLDGTGTTNVLPWSASNTLIGANSNSGSENLSGDLAALLSWNRALTDAEMTAVTNELMTTYVLTGPTFAIDYKLFGVTYKAGDPVPQGWSARFIREVSKRGRINPMGATVRKTSVINGTSYAPGATPPTGLTAAVLQRLLRGKIIK